MESSSGSRRKRPQLNLVQTPVPEPAILQNGAFGNLSISGNAIQIDEDMIRGGDWIGRGGHASVRRVKINGVIMARKDVKVSLNNGGSPIDINSTLEKKLREVKVINGCSSCPFIVHFYGYYVHKVIDCVHIHIFMEELPLNTSYLIEETVRRRSVIPEFVIGRIACSVTNALWFLKRRMQIIHRDIKPSNILIDHDGRVKVCDLGISGVLVNSRVLSEVGCQQYTAPELAENAINNNGYSVKSDVWSLGITVYELAMLRRPYPNLTGINLFGAINNNPPPRLNNSRFSQELVDFVERLLQINMNDRPDFNGVQNLDFFRQHDVPFSCIGTGVGGPNNNINAERESVGAWLDHFLFPSAFPNNRF